MCINWVRVRVGYLIIMLAQHYTYSCNFLRLAVISHCENCHDPKFLASWFQVRYCQCDKTIYMVQFSLQIVFQSQSFPTVNEEA